MTKVMFLGISCLVVFAQYQKGGGTAIQLIEEETGDPMATATVNLPGRIATKAQFMAAGHPEYVLIKDCDENEGVLKSLQEAGIVGEHACYITEGWSRYPMVPLLMKA